MFAQTILPLMPNSLRFWFLVITWCGGACIVAPPEIEELRVNDVIITLPTPNDQGIATHAWGDTLRFHLRARDNGGIISATASLNVRTPSGSLSLVPFFAYTLSDPDNRALEASFQVRLVADSVRQPAVSAGLVNGLFGLVPDELHEIRIEILDNRNRWTERSYWFIPRL